MSSVPAVASAATDESDLRPCVPVCGSDVMRVLLVGRGRRVDGLGDLSQDALYAHTTVGQAVETAAMSLGLAAVRVEDGGTVAAAETGRVIIIPADTFITSTLLEAFVKVAGTGTVRLAVRKTPAVEHALPLQDVEIQPLDPADKVGLSKNSLADEERNATHRVLYDVYACDAALVAGKGGVELFTMLRAASTPVLVEKRELVTLVRLPILPMNKDGGAPTMRFPFTSSVIVNVRHWVHVLWLNQLAPGIQLNLHVRAHPVWTAWKALTGLSFKRENLLQRVSSIHPTARVHPTAYVEGSVVGPNAVVGAHASVRQSVVAEGAEIGEHATLLTCTVGTRAYVTPKSFLVWCAIYPDAVVGNYKLQVSLVGRGAHVNAWAGMIDAKFLGAVRVELDGKLASTERSFLGSCIGHGAQVAAKVLVHPGRVIPAGTVVVMRPDEVVSTVPDDVKPGVPMVRDGGTLVPLASLKMAAG